jgi:hypothetical protein
MRRILLVTALMSSFASPAAALITGNQLYDHCQNEATRSLCVAYITGIAEVTQLIALKADESDVRRRLGFCRPVGVINQQVVDVVVAYLENTPKDRHLPALVNILNALHNNWPCEGGADDY